MWLCTVSSWCFNCTQSLLTPIKATAMCFLCRSASRCSLLFTKCQEISSPLRENCSGLLLLIAKHCLHEPEQKRQALFFFLFFFTGNGCSAYSRIKIYIHFKTQIEKKNCVNKCVALRPVDVTSLDNHSLIAVLLWSSLQSRQKQLFHQRKSRKVCMRRWCRLCLASWTCMAEKASISFSSATFFSFFLPSIRRSLFLQMKKRKSSSVPLFISCACCHACTQAHLSSLHSWITLHLHFFSSPGFGWPDRCKCCPPVHTVKCYFLFRHCGKLQRLPCVMLHLTIRLHIALIHTVSATDCNARVVCVPFSPHQRAAVLSLRSSLSASCCWPSWAVCCILCTRRERYAADLENRTCECDERKFNVS